MGIFNKTRRKATAPFVLALWTFALLAGIAHACGLGEQLEHAAMGKPVAASPYQASDDGTVPACEQFCADDIPLLTKLKAVEDSPAGSALLITARVSQRYCRASAEAASSVVGPDPPPGIAVNTRFVRLAL